MAQIADGLFMWVYGKTEPGWYVAAAAWSEPLAKHWREQGYAVEKGDDSLKKPAYIPKAD